MKSDFWSLHIQRVSNGWIVRPINTSRFEDQSNHAETCVARTPEELAAILKAWAKGAGK